MRIPPRRDVKRGVVMPIARFEPSGDLSLAGVGNCGADVVGPKTVRRFTGSAAVIGAPGPLRRALDALAATVKSLSDFLGAL